MNNVVNLRTYAQNRRFAVNKWLNLRIFAENNGCNVICSASNALTQTTETLTGVLTKARFWDQHATTPLNPRQRLMLNKLLDGFEGKLISSKYAKIAKCSQDTALRDLQNLIDSGILSRDTAGGRSTSYVLCM